MPKKVDRDGVYTRRGRAGFWISYLDQHGNRRQKKTKAQTSEEAKKIRSAIVARVEKLRILGIAEAEAVKFKDVTDRYLTYQKPRLSPQSYDRTESIITNHLIPFFAKNIGEIRSHDIERYTTKRMLVVSSGTVIKEIGVLKHFFRMAVKWELIPTDPSASVERPPTPPDRVRYLEPDEFLEILRHCPEWLKPIAVLAVSTGMRRGEILGLRWHNIKLSNAQILLGKTKSGKPRVVNLNKIAVETLTRLYPGKGAAIGKIWPDVRADYTTQAFKRAAEVAGIEDVHFHDLRHTYASWVKMAGEDTHTISILLGHSDTRMTARYAHLNQSYLSKATARVENILPALLNGYRDPDVTAEAVDKTEGA